MRLFKVIAILMLSLGLSRVSAASIQPPQSTTILHVAQRGACMKPVLAANWFKWLDELIHGARAARHLPGQAYQYTQREDRRGDEHGLLYYLATGIWRLAAAAGAAAIAGSAIEKQKVSIEAKNFATVAPFIAGLFWPLVALIGAGVVWMACQGEKTEPPAGN